MPPEAPPSPPMACGSQQPKRGIRSRRRIFVQTDDGSVLGMEVHRNDKVHSIKKKVQELLRVPTEQSALSFGDLVLQDDVHELRCDSPVLLTSELHRSWSTPCLCPKSASGTAQRRPEEEDGEDEPFEIVGGWSCAKIRKLMDESTKAIRSGVEPVRAQGGLGGAYYFKNSQGDKVAIVKPADEEPLAPNNPRGFVGRRLGQAGLSRSIRVGETGVREVAAYLLDHGHFAKVPATVLVKASHPIFHLNGCAAAAAGGKKKQPAAKIGSFQEYVEHDYDASECGSSRFPASAVHRIGILDIRLFNTDRHSGNMLVRHHVVSPSCSSPAFSSSGASSSSSSSSTASSSSSSSTSLTVCSWPIGGAAGLVDLIPIDHGLCLPESLEDPYFEWLHWPQASFPFSEEELAYIRMLDAAKDADMLRKRLPMLKEACVRMMVLCTRFLQLAAEAGLCLADIGSMMTRELGDEGGACRSQLEQLCMQAKVLAVEQHQQQQQYGYCSKEDNELFDMDPEPDLAVSLCPSPCKGLLYTSRSLPVTRAAVIDEEEEAAEELLTCSTRLSFSASPKPRSRSRRLRSSSGDEDAGRLALSSMNEREWASFLECLVALSGEAFAKHKEQQALLVGVHRLGTSCQF